MRSIIVVIVLSALSGSIIGAALAYVQVGFPREVVADSSDGPAAVATDVAVVDEFPRVQVDELEYDFGRMHGIWSRL